MNPVIVVEGRDDTRRLREIYPDIETIETNGSAIDEETIALIQKALQTREVIVFTDPDYPGTRIRNIIQEHVPGVSMPLSNEEKPSEKTIIRALEWNTLVPNRFSEHLNQCMRFQQNPESQ